ncbi:MAG: C-GCAxxG-C-C family protein [Promethearchaeota archaeon]
MSEKERAVSCFKEGFSCSQAILSTYGARFGLNRELAFRISTAFGGGMGRMGKTCGAITGAFMVIGLKYGKIKIDNDEAKEKTYELVRELVNRFKSINGSITCKKLLNFDISTPEGRALAKEKNLFTNFCPKLVNDSAEILEQILQK